MNRLANVSWLRPLVGIAGAVLVLGGCQNKPAASMLGPAAAPSPCWQTYDANGKYRGGNPDRDAEKCLRESSAQLVARGQMPVFNTADGCSFWAATPDGKDIPGSFWSGCCPNPPGQQCVKPPVDKPYLMPMPSKG